MTRAWKAMNERRIHLIEKEFKESLTPEEIAELEKLQWDVMEELDRKYPIPSPPPELLAAMGIDVTEVI